MEVTSIVKGEQIIEVISSISGSPRICDGCGEQLTPQNLGTIMNTKNGVKVYCTKASCFANYLIQTLKKKEESGFPRLTILELLNDRRQVREWARAIAKKLFCCKNKGFPCRIAIDRFNCNCSNCVVYRELQRVAEGKEKAEAVLK